MKSKRLTRVISLLLSLVMVFSILPTSVYAVEEGQSISVVTAISNIRGTIANILENKKNWNITEEGMAKLATQLYQLENAVKSNGKFTSDVVSVLDETDTFLKKYSSNDSDAILKAKTAAAVVRESIMTDEILLENSKSSTPMVSSFSDMANHGWALDYVMICVNKGAITGTTTPVNGVGTYNPTGKVTLGEFLTVFTRLLSKTDIPDVQGEHWASKYYEAAIQLDLISGREFAATPESLNTALTREQMAHIMVSIAKANGETLSAPTNAKNAIPDYENISYSYKSDVEKCYANGLLTGRDSKGTFAPKNQMTRAEMAIVICRLMNYTERAKVSISSSSSNVSFVQGGYVVSGGEADGLLRSQYSRQFELDALSACRTGEDANGVYVTFTAPVLPDEIKDDFKFGFAADVTDKKDNYFADGVDASLKSGETITIYFKTFDGDKVTKKMIAEMHIGVEITNSKGKSMFVRKIYSTHPNIAYGQYYSGRIDNVDLDSSAVWSGIGK